MAHPRTEEQKAKRRTPEARERHRLQMAAWRKASPENEQKTRDTAKRYREAHPEMVSARKNAWRRKRMEWLNTLKIERGCVDCGYNSHPNALEFDHLDGKEANVSVIRFLAMDRLLGEIAKCEVRCANCHRIKTEERRQAS